MPQALRRLLIQPERSLVTLASRLPLLAHHLPTTLSPALLLFLEALQGGLAVCKEVRAGVTKGREFCEAVCPHPQTSHSSFPSFCSRSRRPGLRHSEMGSWSTRALWALGSTAGPDAGGQSRSSGWLGYSRGVCLPGGKSIIQSIWQPLKVFRTPCSAWQRGPCTFCSSLWPGRPPKREASETHTPRLPWWHFPKRRLSPGGGGWGDGGGRCRGWGAWGGGADHRGLCTSPRCCSVPWATQEVSRWAPSLGDVTGRGGVQVEGSVCFTCGIGISFPDVGADWWHGAHGAYVLAPWEI